MGDENGGGFDAAAILAEAYSRAGLTPSGEPETPQTAAQQPAESGQVEAEVEAVEAPKLSWAEALKSATPEQAKLLKSMQADYTRKSQELAQQRKALQAERASLEAARKIAIVPEHLPDFDYSNESVDARAAAKAAAMLQQVLAPMEERARQAEEEVAYRSILLENPDLETDQAFKKEVAAVLMEDENISLERAIKFVRGQRAMAELEASRRTNAAQRAAQKKSAQAVSMPRNASPTAPPSKKELASMSHAEILALAKQMAGQR
jgi:hypothetical protein